MDQELITRFREGDEEAKTAIRTHLRAVAARVLAAPQWKLKEATTRSALEVQAAVAALESPAQDPVGFAVAAMHAAAVAGLEHLRALDGALGDHPNAEVMAKVALETAAPGHVLHVQRHAESCSACKAHLDALRSALTSAATAQRATTPPPPPAAQKSSPSPKTKKKKDPRPKSKPPRRGKPEPEKGPPIGTIAIVAALVVGAIWWKSQLTDEEKSWQAAAHLPDELPPGAMADNYEGGTRDAIRAMANGQCQEAAGKLHMAWKRTPDDYDLRYLEGLAHICLRDGEQALPALQDVNDNVHWDELPWGFEWWYAQALILNVSIGDAIGELEVIAISNHPRASDAAALADELREAY
ncbi:MAG: hypothetical protein GY913_20575 [Proteobacteria bacterium]|nr:hypothetical protein [Pseudomonadota bacterium]MCP4919304.1 hypothetical protein [Pseudomonadota bacterium]